MGTLYLVATPIGNLEDITLRALRVLQEVQLVAAEDTRHSGRLMAKYSIETPLISYFEHNQVQREAQVLAALARGDVALVSDAGSPGLSDPGYALVRAVLAAGHQVTSVPGPAAPIAALTLSGLPTDCFLFLGYLPRRSKDRVDLLKSVARQTCTLVCFEVPHRLRQALDDMRTALGAERQAAVCRELTKLHEEVLRGSVQDLIQHFEAQDPRGEMTLVIAGHGGDAPWSLEAVRAAIQDKLGEGLSPSQAARAVAAESGWARREVYRLIMEEA